MANEAPSAPAAAVGVALAAGQTVSTPKRQWILNVETGKTETVPADEIVRRPWRPISEAEAVRIHLRSLK